MNVTDRNSWMNGYVASLKRESANVTERKKPVDIDELEERREIYHAAWMDGYVASLYGLVTWIDGVMYVGGRTLEEAVEGAPEALRMEKIRTARRCSDSEK